MGISDWSDMMNQTVSHAEFAGRTEYGVPTYGSSVDYAARVVYKQKFIRKSDGSEVLSQGMVWLQSNVVVTTEDEITLPDGSTPPILFAERFSDETTSFHHTKIYFGG